MINESEETITGDMYQVIRIYQKGLQTRAITSRFENCDEVADRKRTILKEWTNYFIELTNVNEGQDIEEGDVQIPEFLVVLEILVNGKLQIYKDPGILSRFRNFGKWKISDL